MTRHQCHRRSPEAFIMPTLKVPERSNRYILALILYSVIILAWLTPENDSVWLVSLLGTGLALLLVGLAVQTWLGGKSLRPAWWILLGLSAGAITGISAALLTALLMVMKNVQHSHLVLDFPADVVSGILERIPIWTLAGLLVGAAGVLLIIAFYRSDDSPELAENTSGEKDSNLASLPYTTD